MTAARQHPERKNRASHLRWVPISLMRVSPKAQREFRAAHAEKYAANFDFEAIGFPVLNLLSGVYYIVDGQHRIAALKMIGWGDQQIQCEVYEGLDEAEMADVFLRRDDRKAIPSFEKFRIAVTAGRDVESEIDRVVRANDLSISQSKTDGSVGCVASLRKVHARAGSPGLGRTLRIIRDAYGTPGFDSRVVEGLGLVVQRFNGQLDDEAAVARLAGLRGGVNGLLGRAETLRQQTGNNKTHCVAAAVVDVVNAGRGGKKLPSWWRES